MVEEGQTLLVLEAMKTEQSVATPLYPAGRFWRSSRTKAGRLTSKEKLKR